MCIRPQMHNKNVHACVSTYTQSPKIIVGGEPTSICNSIYCVYSTFYLSVETSGMLGNASVHV